MNLTKEQRAARSKAIEQANILALREHFTGEGATSRRLRFVKGALLASAAWLAKLACLASWAVIAGLLVGPDHNFFLTQVHAWMVSTPLEQVLERSHAMFMSMAWELMKISVLLGVGQNLLGVIKPAAEQAKQRFEAAAA